MPRSRVGCPGHAGQDITVAAVTDDGLLLSGSSFRQGGRLFPSLTVAPNGTVHVVWSNHVNNHAQVLATKSTDGGLTWSTPIVAGAPRGPSALTAPRRTERGKKEHVILPALSRDRKRRH